MPGHLISFDLCVALIFALSLEEAYHMRAKFPVKYIFLLLLMACNGFVGAQDKEPFTCFNAQEILFPLESNDFTKNTVLLNDRKVNALYYLYQDKYSFWYKFIATEDVQIHFSVSPSNIKDRYRAVAFKYGRADFCEKLVNENLKPLALERAPIFKSNGTILYRNSLDAAKGDTFYISVLSLNQEDCGHFLHMESGEEALSIHAVHKPCYDFSFLEVPDFTTAKMEGEDAELVLDLGKKEVKEDPAPIEKKTAPVPKLPEPQKAFAAIKTIEIQSKEESMVSVGDKLVLNEVFFYSNTYAFKPGAEVELDQLVDFLNGNPTVEIEIQGHSANNTEDIRPDPNFKSQGPEWNFRGSAFELSEERAKAVRAYLIEKGISKKRLEAAGYGDTQKRVPDAKTFEDFEKNMRVEALIIKE